MSQTPKAIDGGDTLPIRPSRRPKQTPTFRGTRGGRGGRGGGGGGGGVTLHYQQRMENIELAQISLPESSSIYDAQERSDEEKYLRQHKYRRSQISTEKHANQMYLGSKRTSRLVSRRDLSPETAERSDSFIAQKAFQNEHSMEQQNLEKQGQRRRVLLGIVALLTVLIVAAVVVGILTSKIGKLPAKHLTPEGRSRTVANHRTFDSIATFLRTFTTIDDRYFQDTTKPQHQAISWMADIDTYAYSIPESKKDDGYFDFVQRYALAVLFYATNGRKWDDSSYFLKSTHACSWNYEIPFIENEAMKVGVTCDRMKEVTALIMRAYTTA